MGIVLLVVGLAVLGFGLMNHLKGKRILAAPFKGTGELAKNPVSPDPKGAMSTEGKVVPPAEALLSPCTKQPCLAYEVKIERLYEKSETTQDGTKTVKGSETLDTVKGGAVFGLDDGTGVLRVDVSQGADFDSYKEGLKKELNGWGGSSHVQFGEYTFDVPVLDNDKGWTVGFKATERYVPVEGSLFVLGKLEGASLVKPDWRSMMASSKGREGLLGSIQKKKKFSFIGGGLAAALSIPAFIFAPEPDPNAVSAYCESKLTDARQKCADTVSSKSGETYTWTVTKPGQYALQVFAPKKKVAFMPQVVVTDAAGEELANEVGGVGVDALATLAVQPGTYTVTVQPGDGYMVKGGFSYDLEIRALDAAPVAAAPEAAAPEAAPVGNDDAAKVGGYSAAELASRVDDLNELCPDTFCEGSYHYTFTALRCADASHCTLAFTAKNAQGKRFDAEVAVADFTALTPDLDQEYVYEGSFDDKVGQALLAWEHQPVAKKAPAAKRIAAPLAPKPAKKVAPAPTKSAPKAMLAPAKKPAATVAVVKPSPAPAPAPTLSRTNKNLAD